MSRALVYFFTFIFLLQFYGFSSEKVSIDSLRTLLKQEIPDTERVHTLYTLGWELRNSEPLTSIAYMTQSRDLAIKTGYKKGIRDGYSGLGILNGIQGNYKEALAMLNRALETTLEMNDTTTLGSANGNIGLVYYHLGAYTKAIEYYMRAVKAHEAAGDLNGLSSVYNNLGNLYTQNKDFKMGMKYHDKSLKIRLKLNNKAGIATSYGNIGNCYESIKEYEKALDYYNKAVSIQEKLGNEHALSINYGNIANIKYLLKDYENALKLYTTTLKVREKLNDQNGISVAHTGIGRILTELGRYDEAERNFKEAIAIAKKIGAKEEEKDAYNGAANCYYRQHKSDLALKNFLIYDSLNTELVNSYNAKQAADMQANLDIERQQNEISQLKKDADITNLTLKSQRIGIILSVVGLFSVAVILFFVYRNYKDKKKTNALLVEKNSIIEQRSKEVIDSINYAQKIQAAILPSEVDFKKILPDSFTLLKPKDIVSGDFYWIADRGEEVFYATADCTGHGVPGGFMTMLGSSFLNEIINERGVRQPAIILDMLRDKIIAALKQTGASGENKDGMDIVVCRLNKKDGQLAFASANNSLYHVSGGQLKEYKADKQPIGYYHDGTKPFTQQELQLGKGDSVYTFSDGYADQFGGGKGKKFKYSQLKDVLLANSVLSMQEQKRMLDLKIEEWKGNLEQVDDILVIGVRL
ncbi:MAG: tetratricopeptide repeat protein [Bacteroidia bacterium]